MTTQQCDWCSGKGEVECDCTGGMGKSQADDGCPMCGGTARATCTECEGTGKVENLDYQIAKSRNYLTLEPIQHLLKI